MRNRVAVFAAVLAFAVVVGGLAVLASNGSRSATSLPRLPFASAKGEAAMAARSDALMPAPWGGVEYRIAGDVGDVPDTAPAYRRAAPTEADVAGLAAALGVTVKPRLEGRTWIANGETGFLNVDSRTGMWSYGAPSTGGAVAKGGAVAPDTPVGSSTISACAPCPPDAMCAKVCKPTERPEGLPTKDEAEQFARRFWAKVGAAPGKATVEVDDGFTRWYAHYRPLVDGVEVQGGDASVSVGVKGAVASANGWLGSVEKVGDYPLISPKEAVERLNRTAKGGIDCLSATVRCLPAEQAPQPDAVAKPGASETAPCATASDLPGGSTATTAANASSGCSAPATSGGGSGSTGSGGSSTGSAGSAGSTGSGVGVAPPGTVVPEPTTPTSTPAPTIVELTGVRVALQVVDDYLVPVYVFTIKGGGDTGPVPAVPDRLLREPTPEPVTPVEPADGREPAGSTEPAPAAKPEPAPAKP